MFQKFFFLLGVIICSFISEPILSLPIESEEELFSDESRSPYTPPGSPVDDPQELRQQQYWRFFHTAHHKRPRLPALNEDEFIQSAFQFGLNSLLRAKESWNQAQQCEENDCLLGIALVNITLHPGFMRPLNQEFSSEDFKHLACAMKNLVQVTSQMDSPLNFGCRLSEYAFLVHHMDRLVSLREEVEVCRQRWLTKAWQGLESMRSQGRTVVIQQLMVRLMVVNGYRPPNVDSWQDYARALLNQTSTVSSNVESLNGAETKPRVRHITVRTHMAQSDRAFLWSALEQAEDSGSPQSHFSSSSSSDDSEGSGGEDFGGSLSEVRFQLDDSEGFLDSHSSESTGHEDSSFQEEEDEEEWQEAPQHQSIGATVHKRSGKESPQALLSEGQPSTHSASSVSEESRESENPLASSGYLGSEEAQNGGASASSWREEELVQLRALVAERDPSTGRFLTHQHIADRLNLAFDHQRTVRSVDMKLIRLGLTRRKRHAWSSEEETYLDQLLEKNDSQSSDSPQRKRTHAHISNILNERFGRNRTTQSIRTKVFQKKKKRLYTDSS